MCEISVIIPSYMCSQSLPELCSRLTTVLTALTSDYEIIVVNDSSPENDWEVLKNLRTQFPNINGLNLSRNFGQHYAITAGLEYSSGKKLIVMDGDLQDSPESIPALLAELDNGYEVVFARRTVRLDSLFKKISSKIFYYVFDKFTGGNSDSATANFGAFSRKVIDQYLSFNEHTRAFPILVRWLGFPTTYVDVKHSSRAFGKSSYTLSKLFDLALDAIVSHSNRPLKVAIRFGFFISVMAFIGLCWLVIRTLYYDTPIGWTSLITSIFFVGGLLMANLGLLGLYISKIYDEVKNRPLFVVSETLGLDDHKQKS